MAAVNLVNSFEATLLGREYAGWQGATTDEATDAYAYTLTSGQSLGGVGILGTAAARTIWDEDNQFPVDIVFFWLKCDKAFYVQLIGQATQFSATWAAYVPFNWAGNTILAAANTTALSGSAPSVEAIDSIVIQNNSGSDMNYEWRLFY